MIISIKTVQRIKTLILVILLLPLILVHAEKSYASNSSFYKGDNKYKGFYWFENQQKPDSSKPDTDTEFHYPTPEEATRAIEVRKKTLDDARSQMVELAFVEDTPPEMLREAIVKYKKLEAAMYDGAIRLSFANEMANFTNPEIANLTEQPTNVFANKIKRKSDEREKITTIREFARKFDLVVFTNNNCPYSQAFEPVITDFARTHGFILDKTPLDGIEGKIAQNLGITSTPILIAVSKDASKMFEISRGMVGISELEANIILSNKYSNEQKTQSHGKYKNSKGKR
jgi:hypothetical protein